MSIVNVRPEEDCRWDIASLGEVMLRLDPGAGRIHTTRAFDVWEGGGEYNVARGLRRCFSRRATLVSALADNPIGRLVEDLILQGGVDTSHLNWKTYDGVGRETRNGINFVERGLGPRGALSCSDRGHTAVSQMQASDVDLKRLFEEEGVRLLHTGGIYAALGDASAQAAAELMKRARETGTCVSYDLNYRASLWNARGGQAAAQQINRELVKNVDVLFGNEEDFHACLGFEIEGTDENYSELDTSAFRRMILQVMEAYPRLQLVATTLRVAHTASRNDWGAICYHRASDKFFEVPPEPVEIFDRVGGGDSFASGVLEGILRAEEPAWALACGVAHGALAMSTPGDTTMATKGEVERLMQGANARIDR